MSVTGVRWTAMAVFFVVGIPGMIVSSITDHTGAALTFGLLTVGAVLALLAATTVTTGRIPPAATASTRPEVPTPSEAEAEALEQRVQALVAEGADETAVRDLVRAAIRFAATSDGEQAVR